MKKLIFLIAIITIILTFTSCGAYVPYDYDVTKYITLGEYKGLSCEFIDFGVSDADLQAGVNEQLKANGYGQTQKITDGAVILGDKIIFSMTGSVDNKTDDSLALSGYELVVGSGTFLDEFEQALLGQPIGKPFEMKVLFPEDYIKVAYAGKTVEYSVEITSAARMSYPEIDDQIVADISDAATVEAYLDDLRQTLEEEEIKQADIDRETKLWEQTVSNATVIDYPKDALEHITEELKTQFEKAAEDESLSLEEYLTENNLTISETADYIDAQAKRICKDEMVMYAIARQENLTASNKEIKELSSKYVEEYGYKNLKALYKTHSKESIEQIILYQKVKDFILTNSVEN